MRIVSLALGAAFSLGLAAPVMAGASGFTLVNGTGGALSQVEIRRTGSAGWTPLGVAPGAGARASVGFTDPDCAFDIRASVAGQPLTWSGVNLCEVKSVTLNRSGATTWVDYD